jgi:outer membrane protein
MKKVISAIALGFCIFLGSSTYAQDQKIGHINADNLLQLMPEIKAVQTQLEAYRTQLETDLEEMEKELETKIAAYRQNEQMMTQLSRETKAQEIQGLQLRIQDYQQKAGQDLQNKQMELITPIIEKATKAVQDVAKENNFTYILDSSDSKAVVIFVDNGIDIMPLVKKKLGLQ